MCNECGNCAVFCPYDSRPYKDKFTLFANEADFADSTNEGFTLLADGKVKVRYDNEEFVFALDKPDSKVIGGVVMLIAAIIKDYGYLLGW
jgi:putative selenate reductase